MLPVQVFVHYGASDPDAQKPQPEKMDELRARSMSGKPGGGLWTSSQRQCPNRPNRSSWMQHVESTPDFRRIPSQAYLLRPRSEASIFTVRTVDDFTELAAEFGTQSVYHHTVLNWAAVAVAYDGVRVLDEPARRLNRSKEPTTPDGESIQMAMWSAESTVFFNWCFEAVEHYAHLDRDQTVHPVRPRSERLTGRRMKAATTNKEGCAA